jgi:hypothetical protein
MSEPLSAPTATNTFERIKRTNAEGNEFWSARNLARVLEYSEYRHFLPVIEKAKEACLKSNHRVEDHFEQILEMVGIGSGAQRGIEDWKFSRYASYLVIQNARSKQTVGGIGTKLFRRADATPGNGRRCDSGVFLRSQNTTSSLHGGRRYRPFAFTEHGALMAANVLNSPYAITMSVYLIRAFVKVRETLAANVVILKRLAEIDKTLLTHDAALLMASFGLP